MELKIVYRILRKISDWTVAGYYSEIHIEGAENIPEDGPVITLLTPTFIWLRNNGLQICASTHHNEIIDIAALAAEMPHRRHISCWAKSTMFANPIAGAILYSSGTIPVKRNPNAGASPSQPAKQDPSSSTGTKSNATFNESATRAMLFRETSRALAENRIIGVFPEGTSYTESSIVQIMPGAGWAAVEYARYVRETGTGSRERQHIGKGKGKVVEDLGGTGLRIVPVAIVYTDKSQYLSRFSIRYGEPILIDNYARELFDGDRDETSKTVVKKVMGQVEAQMRAMTINAPDWDTICAVSMARNILWDDEDKIPLKDWVEISQRLVRIFDPTTDQLKVALTKYYALLHYSGIKHSILLSLLPLSDSSILDVPRPPSAVRFSLLMRPTLSLLLSLPVALVQFILFTPPLLLHLPGYITGPLAKKCLAQPGEEEAAAQFKAIGGGLGIGANVALALGVLWKQNKIGHITTLLGFSDRDSTIKKILGVAGSIYLGIVLLVRWHNILIKANYRTLQRLLTYFKLVSALAVPHKFNNLGTAVVDMYSKVPLPAANAFIKKREPPSSQSVPGVLPVRREAASRKEAAPLSWKLIPHLLVARQKACAALAAHLETQKDQDLMRYLLGKGAKMV